MSENLWRKPAVPTFLVRVDVIRESDGYSVSCRTLPGAASQGDTLEEAMSSLREALVGVLESYRAHGEAIPWVPNVEALPGDRILFAELHPDGWKVRSGAERLDEPKSGNEILLRLREIERLDGLRYVLGQRSTPDEVENDSEGDEQ